MSAPVSDDESPEYQKYAPKRLREQQPQLHPSSQSGVPSPSMSPSHAQIQDRRTETSGSPSSGGDLGNEVPRRLYEPEPVSQPRAPVSDDESSEHQMYAPKRLREQPQLPRPHSSASLRRPCLPRTHKCKATGEKHPGSLPPEEIWKTRCPDDCTSPNPCPSSHLQRRGYSVLTVDQLAYDRSGVHGADRDDRHNHETTLARVRYAAPTASVQTI